MVLNFKIIIILTSLLLLIPQGQCLVFKAVRLSIPVVLTLAKLWDFTKQAFTNNIHIKPKEMVRIVLSKVLEMGSILDSIQTQLDFEDEVITKQVVSQLYKIDENIQAFELFEDIEFINRMDIIMRRYVNNGLLFLIKGIDNKDPLLRDTSVEEFANTLVSLSSRSVLMRNERMCKQVLGTIPVFRIEFVKGGLYSQLLYYYETGSIDRFQPSFNLLTSAYYLIEHAQLKAYRLIQFAWMILHLHKLGVFVAQSKMLAEHYLIYVKMHAEAIKNVIMNTTNVFTRPDPEKYSTFDYEELTKLNTGIILNEADVSKDKSCIRSCEYFKRTKQYHCIEADKDQCKQQRRCTGSVTNCKYRGSKMSVCSPSNKSIRRRYYNMKYDDRAIVYGDKKKCDVSRRIESWSKFIVVCHYCMCFCDESGDMDSYRHFNLRPITSDIKHNKIITGLRLQRLDNVFHLQIQEGLFEKGVINMSSVAWQKSVPFSTRTAISGEDYHSLTSKKSSMHLDDVILPKGYFLTGIKFTTVKGNLQLAIRGTKYKDNKLVKDSSWFNDKSAGKRKLISIGDDIPIHYHDHKEDSKNFTEFKFITTSWEADMAQSTVPFLDVQEIVLVPSYPLIGAGIYHRGRLGSGGFIALKLFTSNDIEGYDELVEEVDNTILILKKY